MNSKRLSIRFAVAFGAVYFFGQFLAFYSRNHFLPNQKMNAALLLGPGCIAYTGDSKMVAALDPSLLLKTLTLSKAPCVADLSLGGLDILGQRIILREYLERGGIPRLVVLGYATDSLIDSFDTIGHAGAGSVPPDLLRGNEAAVLMWSHFDDVFKLYEGFPWQHFDSGFRFLVSRSTNLGVLGSLLWRKTQLWQEALDLLKSTEIPRETASAEGTDAVVVNIRNQNERMRKLLSRLGSMTNLPFAEIEETLYKRKIPFILAQLPVTDRVRQQVVLNPENAPLYAWIKQEVSQSGGQLIDLSHPKWIQDSLFSDTVHLGEKGRELFTSDLAREIKALE